jgi:hypothetical protein
VQYPDDRVVTGFEAVPARHAHEVQRRGDSGYGDDQHALGWKNIDGDIGKHRDEYATLD